jgi:hypothetical protein
MQASATVCKGKLLEIDVKRNLVLLDVERSVEESVEAQCYKPEGRGFDYRLSLDFRIDALEPHCDPGVDSACNRNEYQECS